MKQSNTLKKIWITGANGQLGTSLALKLSGGENNLLLTDIELDITNEKIVREFVSSNKIDIIINCAAFTNVDIAEVERDKARLINAIAPKNLAKVSKEYNILLIHISTDYVFGKNVINHPIDENEIPSPLGVYGSTKLEGERFIQESDCNYLIIRTAWLYSEYGKNFVKTMLSLFATKENVGVVYDQIGSPTYASDLANAICQIINKLYEIDLDDRYKGVYHFSNEGVCSWYDFAQAILEVGKIKLNGKTKKANILPLLSKQYPTKAIRPSFSLLDKGKIKETFGIEIPYWKDSLKKCINNLK